MRGRERCWVIGLAGLPFACFVSRFFLKQDLDIWHAQAWWAQTWILLLFLTGLWNGLLIAPQPAVAAYMGWTWLSTLWVWNAVLKTGGQYPVGMLFGPLHVGFLLLFLLSADWTSACLEHLLTWVGLAGGVLILYGFLQWAQLDEFFRNLVAGHPDVIVGTIGNPSHFANELALLMPIYLFRSGWWKVLAGLNGLLLLVLAFVNHSVGGLCAAGVVVLWWLWWSHRRWVLPVIGLGFGLALLSYWRFPNVWNPENRMPAWVAYWALFREHPITGYGLGYVRDISERISLGPLTSWRHVHNEYFQIAIEQGLIGLGLVGWMLYEKARAIVLLPKTVLLLTVAGMGMVFLLLSLIHFPAHLWVTGSLGLLAFCGIDAVQREAA